MHWLTNGASQVFMLSISGSRVRVLQAHYEHPHVVIRKSEIVDMRGASAEDIQSVVGWLLSKPCNTHSKTEGSAVPSRKTIMQQSPIRIAKASPATKV